MVEIREFKEPVVQLFDPNDNYIGDITSDLSFTDVCVQIKKQKLSGYYVIFDNKKIIIDENGRYVAPKGLYDQLIDLLLEL